MLTNRNSSTNKFALNWLADPQCIGGIGTDGISESGTRTDGTVGGIGTDGTVVGSGQTGPGSGTVTDRTGTDWNGERTRNRENPDTGSETWIVRGLILKSVISPVFQNDGVSLRPPWLQNLRRQTSPDAHPKRHHVEVLYAIQLYQR